jgi:aspartyl-tRNA(Asn)/glutamyl-tRNA(Gln) amidotransferase subunit A
MVSLGSDTGGSVRQPADFCGVIGLKPTYGRISRYGLIAYASSFDQIGLLAKNTDDIACTLEVIAGFDKMDSTSSPAPVDNYSALPDTPAFPLRIAYFREAMENDSLDKEIRSQLQQFIKQLQNDGHTVEPVEFSLIDYIVPAYYILTTAEASSNLARYDGVRYGSRHVDKNTDLMDFYCQNRSNGFGWEVKKRIMLGSFVLSAGYFDAYFTHAQKVRKKLCIDTELIFNNYDYILLPNSPSTAFSLGEKKIDPIAMYLADIFTVYSNLTGVPSVSIPLFWHNNGLPFGVQVMTRKLEELPLLRLTRDWTNKYSTSHKRN